MSRDAIELAISRHAATATTQSASLIGKHVTVHTLRHSCAMDLLQAGPTPRPSRSGSATPTAAPPSAYLHADLVLKEKTLTKVAPTPQATHRYQPADPLLAFLESF